MPRVLLLLALLISAAPSRAPSRAQSIAQFFELLPEKNFALWNENFPPLTPAARHTLTQPEGEGGRHPAGEAAEGRP